MRTSLAIAEILRREGVDLLFGYPRNPVLEAAAEAGIRTIIVRQERTGLHMADAPVAADARAPDGRVRDAARPGHRKCLWRRRPGLFGIGAGAGPAAGLCAPPRPRARQLQRGARRCAASPSMPSRSPPRPSSANVLRRAFTQLRNGRPRPVLVELPWDVLGEEMPGPTRLRAGRAHPLRTRSAGGRRGGRRARRGRAAGHLCRPGRPLGRGL